MVILPFMGAHSTCNALIDTAGIGGVSRALLAEDSILNESCRPTAITITGLETSRVRIYRYGAHATNWRAT
ncbi:hypothetical protein, partial [Xanthomonas fragariae]